MLYRIIRGNIFQLKPIIDYDGDRDQLGNAEQFYLELHTLKGYKLRIDAMVLRLDFKVTLDRIKPAIEMYINTCENLMENEDLKIFLRFVLHTGNFLNSVSLCSDFLFEPHHTKMCLQGFLTR